MSRPMTETLIACYPVNADDYPPAEREAWMKSIASVIEQGHRPPVPYPDSTKDVCADCGVQVAIGPLQLAKYHTLKLAAADVHVICMLCAAGRARAGRYQVLNLQEEQP